MIQNRGQQKLTGTVMTKNAGSNNHSTGRTMSDPHIMVPNKPKRS